MSLRRIVLRDFVIVPSLDLELDQGFNVLTGEYTDMIKAGVIDPVKVVRGALENAASIAAMILTTDVLITDLPEKDKAPAMPPGGMGGMDY